WGPRSYTGEIVILVGEPESGARKEFSSVEVGATLDIPYAYFYETRPILLCRGLKGNLQAVWPRVKNWRYPLLETKLQNQLRQRIAILPSSTQLSTANIAVFSYQALSSVFLFRSS